MIVALIILATVVLYLLALRCRRGNPKLTALRGWGYAHRGLHGNGVPENSMTAFQLALEGGYGIELDVQLSKDGVVLTGPDLEHGGKERTVIAYYVYYRK